MDTLINWLGLKEPERSIAQLLVQNLLQLSSHLSNFEDALALADFCDGQRELLRYQNTQRSHAEIWQAADQNRLFVKWKTLAIRDGAVTLSNFAECKQAVEKLIGRCPSLFDKLDRKAYSEAGRIWKDAFPGYAHIRLDVAHSGKLFNAPEKREVHSIPGTRVVMRQMVIDRTMQSSINGKMASYSLVTESAAALRAVYDAIIAGYRPVADFTRTLPAISE